MHFDSDFLGPGMRAFGGGRRDSQGGEARGAVRGSEAGARMGRGAREESVEAAGEDGMIQATAPGQGGSDAWDVLSEVLYVRGRGKHAPPVGALLDDAHMFRAHPETGRIGGLAASLLRSFAFIHQADPDVFLGGPQRDMEDARRKSILAGEDVADLAKHKKSVFRESRVKLKAISGVYGQSQAVVYELVRRKMYLPSQDGTLKFSNRVLVSMHPLLAGAATDGGRGNKVPANVMEPDRTQQSGDMRTERMDNVLKRTGSGIYAQAPPSEGAEAGVAGTFAVDGPEESLPKVPFGMPAEVDLDEEHYYSPKVKARRQRLRKSPVFIDLMCSLWMLLIKRFAKEGEHLKEPTVQRLPKVGYLALAKFLNYYLVNVDNTRVRDRSGLLAIDCENDWVCDGGRKGGTVDLGVMAFSTFFKALFELTDAWVVSSKEDDYLDFLLLVTEGMLSFLQHADESSLTSSGTPRAHTGNQRHLRGVQSPGSAMNFSEQDAARRAEQEESRYLIASQGRVIHGTFSPLLTPFASEFFRGMKPKAATRQGEVVDFILSNDTAHGGGKFSSLRSSFQANPPATSYGRRLPRLGQGYLLPASARSASPRPQPAGGFRRAGMSRAMRPHQTTRQAQAIYSDRTLRFEAGPHLRSPSPGTVLPARAMIGAGYTIDSMGEEWRTELKVLGGRGLRTPL